ncbi:MAG: hypothetical protein M1826_001802 [Phylliscum demangeonii]|nr:MAG: hypothetical protein M1826_001802 [Phylliscum demangeonii]
MSTPGPHHLDNPASGTDKEPKPKVERSKIKLFSKPKTIGISREKETEKRDRGLPSPHRMGVYGPSPLANSSTTSLADSTNPGTPSTNPAFSIPPLPAIPSSNDTGPPSEKKHHFLSRQRHKHRDKDDHHLPLSSAASNSKPADPHAPQSLYSFTPASPGSAATTFAKTVSGLDLRHGGRALREKKREEKASAAANAVAASNAALSIREDDAPPHESDWPGTLFLPPRPSIASSGPAKSGSVALASGLGLAANDPLSQVNLQGFGLAGMTPDDAWPFLKAKLLVLFEGEDVRLPIEDLNKLVLVHVQRCIQARSPNSIVDELQDLLYTGFASFDHTLRQISGERLIPSLVDIWLAMFSAILPYLQAVFLPLDLEFKGSGSILAPRDASAFWATFTDGKSHLGAVELLEMRRIILVAFRDSVILSRHNALQTVFSRLSLDSLNGSSDGSFGASHGSGSEPPDGAAAWPDSFNSQGSTLLNEPDSFLGARSRAMSNTSSAAGGRPLSPTAHSISSPPRNAAAAMPPARLRPGTALPTDAANSTRVTETVGRMLQCVSVLASIRSGDEAQIKMDGLAKTLKHNWLGRGRTGRNRKGFVGTKMATPSVRVA